MAKQTIGFFGNAPADAGWAMGTARTSRFGAEAGGTPGGPAGRCAPPAGQRLAAAARRLGLRGCLLLGLAGVGRGDVPAIPRDGGGAVANATAAAHLALPIITVWTHSPEHTAEFDALKEAALAFNRRRRDYRVEVFPSIYRSYEDRIRSAAASGALPWVVELDGPFLSAFVWAGFLRSLDRWAPRELLDDLLPSVIAQGTYQGRLYSLGQYDSGLGLWGNRRLLRAAGLRLPRLETPWSLAEFEQAMAKLTAAGGVEYALSLNVYDAQGEFYTYAYSPILQGFGGDLIDRKTFRSARGVLDGPESVLAMTHFQNWFKRGWSRAVLDRTDDFEQGRTALSWSGHWKYPTYRAALAEDLTLMPLPDFGQGIKTGIGSWSWGISSTCPNPAGAWAFLAHLLSPEEILRMTGTNGAVPSRRSALARSPLYSADGPLRLFARQLELGLGVPRPATPGYDALRGAFTDAVKSIIAGGDARRELGRAAAAIEEDITRHNGYPPR